MFIKCMCMWNKKNQVLELVSSWLSEATNKFASSEEGKNPKANESLQVSKIRLPFGYSYRLSAECRS